MVITVRNYRNLSPRNTALWKGYSNAAAVVPCVFSSIQASKCGPCERDRDYTIVCLFIKLGRHVNHDLLILKVKGQGHN